MSGYKAGYSEEHSPFFKAGQGDGADDRLRLACCPPCDPIGYDPDKGWSAMYRRGYAEKFTGAVRHSCKNCRAEKAA